MCAPIDLMAAGIGANPLHVDAMRNLDLSAVLARHAAPLFPRANRNACRQASIDGHNSGESLYAASASVLEAPPGNLSSILATSTAAGDFLRGIYSSSVSVSS